jgi:hypothetical protein
LAVFGNGFFDTCSSIFAGDSASMFIGCSDDIRELLSIGQLVDEWEVGRVFGHKDGIVNRE